MNLKIAQKNVKNPGKSCFAVRKEWVNKLNTDHTHRYTTTHSVFMG